MKFKYGYIVLIALLALFMYVVVTYPPTIEGVRSEVKNPLLLILKCSLLSILAVAACAPFWDQNIFDSTGDKIKDVIGEFYAKPLFGCYVCATFWHSIGWCLLFGWPWYLNLPAMGISAIISQLSKE